MTLHADLVGPHGPAILSNLNPNHLVVAGIGMSIAPFWVVADRWVNRQRKESAMAYVTKTTMALGLFMSMIAGTVYYYGSGGLAGHFSWLPHADLMLGNPGAVLAIGAVVMILSTVCRPCRFE